MPETPTLLIFVAACATLLIIPGPAVIYIVTRSIDQGRIAGIVSVLGIALGTLFHVIAAALGLSAILVSSALAFSIVKYLGAAYLVYLGMRKLFAKTNAMQAVAVDQKRLSRIFTQGVIVNVLNPKTALFIFAFLPQFVDHRRGPVAPQMLLLGLILVTMGLFSDGVYAMLAGTMGQWLRGNRGFARAQKYLTGSIYIGLGLVAALGGGEHSK